MDFAMRWLRLLAVTTIAVLLVGCSRVDTDLGKAIQASDDQKVSQLLSAGHNPNAVVEDYRKRTAIELAAQYNDVDIMKQLVAAGAGFQDSGEFGVFPLAVAAGYGSYDAAEYLLSQGANVNQRTDTSWTALHTAALHGFTDVCLLLLESGADASVRTVTGETPHDLATYAGYTDTAQLIERF